MWKASGRSSGCSVTWCPSFCHLRTAEQMFRSKANQIKMTPQGGKRIWWLSASRDTKWTRIQKFLRVCAGVGVCVCLISASLPGTESCWSCWKVDSVAALWHRCQPSSVHDGCGSRGEADHCVTEQTSRCHAPQAQKPPPLRDFKTTTAPFTFLCSSGPRRGRRSIIDLLRISFYQHFFLLWFLIVFVRMINYMYNHNYYCRIIYTVMLFMFPAFGFVILEFSIPHSCCDPF